MKIQMLIWKMCTLFTFISRGTVTTRDTTALDELGLLVDRRTFFTCIFVDHYPACHHRVRLIDYLMAIKKHR